MSDNGRLGLQGARDMVRPGGLSSPHHGASIGAFPPIADYAYLSDCEVGALVAPSGNVEWMCPPKFDAPSVFGAMLDRDAGRFRLSPADVTVPASRRYLPGTMILETTWMTRTGWLLVYDFLAIGPWHHEDEREQKHRRAPSDYEAKDCLVRIASCVQGVNDVNLECSPQFDYAQKQGNWEYAGPGYSQALATTEDSRLKLLLNTSLRVGFEGRLAAARTTLRENESTYVSLSWSDSRRGPETTEEAYEWMHRTANFWREWLNQGTFPDHRWRGYLERSAMALKGMSYAPTGAVIAAPTTSLPREPGGERNWDSRYVFLRDAAFTLWALYSLDFDWEADDFFYFLADQAEADGSLQNIYPVAGNGELEERTLPNLAGYEGARPVRVGNAAYGYEQHDIWGAVLDAAYLHARSRDKLPERVWPIVRKQVEQAVQHWRETDRGIWALRGEPQHYTSSKAMCWCACDRGARLAELRDELDLAARWQSTADEIKEDVLANALDERGVFTMHYGTSDLDASVLLLPLVRFLPTDDYRVRNTVFAISDELVENGIVLRHHPRSDEPVHEVAGGEAFIACSFWLVSAFAEIGEFERARSLCERMLSHASPLGLYAEHLDPYSGRHLGNFPNAFTHLALINAVLHIIRIDQLQQTGRLTSPHAG
ncbi:MAG TPA: glycoside hydrolase family 15 protein [Thermoleophilaceae bacterium]|jgi:GH15 family glucan-1,4-alpha-glucosidase|nr:glycoside hydrolase family 15 protein [Thermoleophilaceae bacterium]